MKVKIDNEPLRRQIESYKKIIKGKKFTEGYRRFCKEAIKDLEMLMKKVKKKREDNLSKRDLILIRDILFEINKDKNLINLFDNVLGVYGRFNQCDLGFILILIENKLRKIVGTKEADQWVTK